MPFGLYERDWGSFNRLVTRMTFAICQFLHLPMALNA